MILIEFDDKTIKIKFYKNGHLNSLHLTIFSLEKLQLISDIINNPDIALLNLKNKNGYFQKLSRDVLLKRKIIIKKVKDFKLF